MQTGRDAAAAIPRAFLLRLLAFFCSAILLCSALVLPACAEPLLYPSNAKHGVEDASRMVGAAAGRLAPVYAPLAEQIARDLELTDKKGIGIDLGSGPGTLIIELCKRTRLHWINADINPHFFPQFIAAAEKAGVGGRVSAVFADAQALPFRDGYADVIVSRGSLQFWDDKRLAFSEICRVLKPGGVAYIGRGFSANLPPDVARTIRNVQNKNKKRSSPEYDVADLESELRAIMKHLKIEHYTIHIPKPPGSDGINYGIWVEIHKQES